MVYVGPWITPDPVVHTNQAYHSVVDNFRSPYFEMDDVYGSVDAGDYTDLTLAANSAPAEDWANEEPFWGPVKFAFRWIQDELTPQDLIDGTLLGRSAILKLREMYKAISVSPWTEGAIYYWPGSEPGGPSTPPGAVAVQWEGMDEPSALWPLYTPCEVVSLTISGNVIADHHDSVNVADTSRLQVGDTYAVAVVPDQAESWDSDSVDPAPTVVPDDDFFDHGDWDPTNTLGGPPAVDLPIGALPGAVGVLVGPVEEDYTGDGQEFTFIVPGHQLDDWGRAVMYTQMIYDTTATAATGEDPIGGPTAEQAEPPGITGSTYYGYHLPSDMTCEWTLQPPRYRWIFGTGPVAPPLRRVQRDDRLGNGARNTPSSRQHSPRNIGYL